MQKSCKFPSGSQYEGFYNTLLHCMEGFGRYLFPDGSEYRGYFKRGKFHGYGRIRLAQPYRFTFIGEFEEGELIQLYELIYPDGLQLFATVTPNGLNTDNWQYCTEQDRRYPSEVCMGLDAVSPLSTETRNRPPRDLRPGTFDKEEGIYLPSTGFLTQIPKPFCKNRFVSCQEEVNWIKKFCRRGTSNAQPVEPDMDIGRRIIDMNVQSMADLGMGIGDCSCGPGPAGNVPTSKWCRHIYDEVRLFNTDQSSSDLEQCTKCRSIPTSDSESSFPQEQITVNLPDRCADESSTLKLLEPADTD